MTEKLLQKSQFTWKKVAVWLFVIIVYNFLGAFTFVYVEECNGDYQSTQLQDKIHVNTTENIIKLCAEIKEIVDVNNCTGNFLSLNRLPYFNNLCRQVEELHRLNTTKSTDAKTIEPECNMLNYNLISKWSTFCLVSILTIGYGDVVPKTTTGKMLTVLYVIIGIPLALCLLTNLADNMLALHFVAVDFIDEKILRQEKRTYVNMKVFTLNIFFLLLTVTFMVGLVCVHDRSMTVVNSFYFVIITITTVGYGDFTYKADYFESVSKAVLWLFQITLFFILLSMFGSLFNLLSSMAENKKFFICSKYSTENPLTEGTCPSLRSTRVNEQA